jgi:predicted transcriptional regulator
MGGMLSVRVDEALLAALEDEARRTSRSKGEIVRQALQARLAFRPRSARASLARYAGVIAGPRDLSTNKKRLSGFGRGRRSR